VLFRSCHNSTITCLDLGDNNIGAEGAKYLAEMLCHNSTIIDLYLGNNNIGAEGVKYLAEMLCHNSTITSLDLRYNNIGDVNTGHIKMLISRNNNYQKYKGTFKMFINTSVLPEELYNIIEDCILLQC
jgi:Ran GTPase-activating protein (RanGAP) involved in mRNA processing and transport